MKAFNDMTYDEKLVEIRRREELRGRGLPLTPTAAELAASVAAHNADVDARLEKEIQADVVKLYRAHGCVVFSLSQPRATKQTPGIGDLYVFWPELHYGGPASWWHETKTPTGRARPDQREFRELCDRCGVGYVMGGLGAAESKLREIGAMR